MTTQDHDVVDGISQRHDGTITLLMIEPREWTKPATLLADIEKKLSNYVTFVSRGGLADQPTLKPSLNIRIELSCQHAPPPATQRLFEQALAFTRSNNIDFVVTLGVDAKRIFWS
jgi:hypothetical protein